MALSDDERAVFETLSGRLGNCQLEIDVLHAYYKGAQRLEHLGLAVPPELRRFIVILNFPRVAVNAVRDRLKVNGFRLAGSSKTDAEMWRVWQANNMDLKSRLGFVEALVARRSYLVVGTNPRDPETPLMTVESPRTMTAVHDPVTGQVVAALRKYANRGVARVGERATLMLPDATVWLYRGPDTAGWEELGRDEHMLGAPPVEVLVNRPLLGDWFGESEMSDVIPLTDAAARALTNLQILQETMATPQRYVIGARPTDFVDPQSGQQLTEWETYFGSVWALMNEEASAGQFTAADLSNFTGVVEHYAKDASVVSGVPARYFGVNPANPPTEGSVIADEDRLIMNVRDKMTTFEETLERGMRLVRRFVDGAWDPELQSLETKWANPETPTQSQTADAITKLTAATVNGTPVLPLRMAREWLGWSEGDISRAEAMDAAAPADPIATLADQLARQTATPPTAGQAAG